MEDWDEFSEGFDAARMNVARQFVNLADDLEQQISDGTLLTSGILDEAEGAVIFAASEIRRLAEYWLAK